MAMINLSRPVLLMNIGCLLLGSVRVSDASRNVSNLADRQAPEAAATTTIESRTVSVRINRPFPVVYAFLAAPENWNQWAHGLGKSIRRSKDGWIADNQDGTSRVKFTPRNAFGIVDHYVIRKSGSQIYVPMRLIVNGNGCELLFTLFREPDMTDERYAGDLDYVRQDLNGLKDLLERRP